MPPWGPDLENKIMLFYSILLTITSQFPTFGFLFTFRNNMAYYNRQPYKTLIDYGKQNFMWSCMLNYGAFRS